LQNPDTVALSLEIDVEKSSRRTSGWEDRGPRGAESGMIVADEQLARSASRICAR